MRTFTDVSNAPCPTCTAKVPVEAIYRELIPTHTAERRFAVVHRHPLWCPACRAALLAVEVTVREKQG